MVPVNGSLTVTTGNGRISAMQKTIKIVLLDDGDTWAGDANVVTLTEKGYNDLSNGTPFRLLDKEDVVKYENVYQDDSESR